jgi:hypothetical protein
MFQPTFRTRYNRNLFISILLSGGNVRVPERPGGFRLSLSTNDDRIEAAQPNIARAVEGANKAQQPLY